jgi:myo-inositol-1-phosphate synthase
MFQRNGRAEGSNKKLAVLMPGLGAVATTFIAGVELLKRGQSVPVGSLTQMGMMADGRDRRMTSIRELVPLASLEDLAFGAWDIVNEDAARVADRSDVLSREHLEQVRPALERIQPRPGVHDPQRVRRIRANHVITAQHSRERLEILREDIRRFKRELGCARAVMVFCASTEAYHPPTDAVSSLKALNRALDASDPALTPTLLYACAALSEGVPFVNGTPNVSVDARAIQELAQEQGVPLAGKDFKTGQTLMKTVVAPALKARLLGLRGWFSTNILGNRDGEVLDDPQAFRSKEITKTGVLDDLLSSSQFPQLYGEISHKVSIHYYPPRGDQKEGWDNIDLFGWLGYPMQLKINFLCRDSILAAPLVLDLALFMDLASRMGRAGIQDWLSFYFKSPLPPPGRRAEQDLFVQRSQLEAALREMAAQEEQRSRRALAPVVQAARH